MDGSTVVEDKRDANSSQNGCNSDAHPHRPFSHAYARTRAHMHTCTLAQLQTCKRCRPAHTHLHTCFCPDVHTFNNFGSYARKECLRHLFTCQIISHLVTSKHCTSHRFICNDADPRDTFIARITQISIHPRQVSQHITQSHNNSVRRQHSTAQHSAPDHTTQSHRITSHHTDVEHHVQYMYRKHHRIGNEADTDTDTHEHNT